MGESDRVLLILKKKADRSLFTFSPSTTTILTTHTWSSPNFIKYYGNPSKVNVVVMYMQNR